MKQRKGPPVTLGKTKEELSDMKGVLKADKPNHILYSFKGARSIPPSMLRHRVRPWKTFGQSRPGSLDVEGQDPVPLDKQNLLLQVLVHPLTRRRAHELTACNQPIVGAERLPAECGVGGGDHRY